MYVLLVGGGGGGGGGGQKKLQGFEHASLHPYMLFSSELFPDVNRKCIHMGERTVSSTSHGERKSYLTCMKNKTWCYYQAMIYLSKLARGFIYSKKIFIL